MTFAVNALSLNRFNCVAVWSGKMSRNELNRGPLYPATAPLKMSWIEGPRQTCHPTCHRTHTAERMCSVILRGS